MFEGTAEIIKTKEKEANLEKAKKLAEFCSANGNPIKFIEYGENFDLEEMNLKIPASFKVFLLECKSFLNSPIFTDTFSKDHHGRSKWEKENERLMDKEIYNLYNSNKLGVNNFGSIISSLERFIEKLQPKDFKLKNELINIQYEILFGETEDLIKKEEDIPVYTTLEDDKKIKLIQKFSKIVEKLISVLEDKV